MERTDFEQWKAREVARLLALVETERRYYQEMVASLPVALVVLSADRSIVSANRAFRQTFGLRSEDLRRKTIEQIIPAPQLIERIRETHISGASQPDLYLDIENRPLRIALMPIRNWGDEGELETLLMVEDLQTIGNMLATMGFSAGFSPGSSVESSTEPSADSSINSSTDSPSDSQATPEAEPTGEAEPPAVVEEAPAPPPVEDLAAPEPVDPSDSDSTDSMVPAPIVEAPVTDSMADASVPAVFWRADADTFRFTLIRGAAEQLLGYPASHWLETPDFFSHRIHSEDRAAAMTFYQAAIARIGDASAEFRAVAASGAVIWCRETIRVPEFPATDSETRSITGVLTDITLRKQLEEQLLTGERHDALHGLSSRLAHDLNNPLMIITGYSEEMLQTLSAQDPMRDDVQQILGATERISGITGQLLAFTRRLANPPQKVEIGMLITAMELHIARAAGPGVTVEIAGAGEPVWAAADPSQLEETILALIAFASEDPQDLTRVTVGWEIDAIPEHMPEATLKPGMYARILIHDDGRGVDAARRVTIFESILSGKNPERLAELGLARAYAMVREWEGDIAFSSDPDRGSTFMLYLPYAPPVEVPPVEPPVDDIDFTEETSAIDAVEPIAEPAAGPPPLPVEPMRETVLLVEDEGGIRALVRKILSRERYRILEASSGEDALTIALSHDGPIHLLLTDVMLPGIGGRDLAEDLRQSLPDLRVVYVSGYTDDEAVRAGWFPPGSLFLQKPFTLSALVNKVRESLDAE
jgi:PAS domain S-box-containing protein